MKLFVQASAEQDIVEQFEWYAKKQLPHIARRFHDAILDAIDAVLLMPLAAPTRPTQNPHLTGVRAWRVTGFEEVWVYTNGPYH